LEKGWFLFEANYIFHVLNAVRRNGNSVITKYVKVIMAII